MARREQKGSGPDFSVIDSQEKAAQAARKGQLAPLLLLPAEFGGTDDPRNVVFVPPWVPEIKASTDANVIGPLVDEGRVQRYAAEPQYQGKSFVPNAIVIRAWDPGQFTSTIKIWGEALRE